MTDVASILSRQASTVRPSADLDDVHRRIRRHRRRTRTTRTAGMLVVLAIVAGVVVATRPARQPPPLATPPEVDIETVGALVLTGQGATGGAPNGYIERVDSVASDGPRSVVVRQSGGRLGRGSLVLTAGDDPSAPAPAPGGQVVGVVNTVLERPEGRLTVRAAGVPADDVASIVANARVLSSRPSIQRSGRLTSYAIVSAATSRPPVIREGRYGCDDLGETSLGGLCFTGVATAAGFEDALYAVGFKDGPTVGGQPTVFSTNIIASGVLAWEPQPGVIAFVGYSGGGNPDDAADALARLAERTTFISSTEWRALNPQRGDQTNNWR